MNIETIGYILAGIGAITLLIGFLIMTNPNNKGIFGEIPLSGTITPIAGIVTLAISLIFVITGTLQSEKEKAQKHENNIEQVITLFESTIEENIKILKTDKQNIYVQDENGQKYEINYKDNIMIEYRKIPKEKQ